MEQLRGSHDRAALAEAQARIKEAEKHRQMVSTGGSSAAYILNKMGIRSPKRFMKQVLVGLGVAVLTVTAVLTLPRVIGCSAEDEPSIVVSHSDRPDVLHIDDEDRNIIFSDIDRSFCLGVKITGNPVKIRSGAGVDNDSIGEAYSTDNMTFPYLGEKQDGDGATWFKLQYTADRAGWVMGQFAVKVYDMTTPFGSNDIAQIAEKYQAMGVQMAVVHNGRIMNHYEYGWAEVGTHAMTADTYIRSASLSKIALAVNAFRLQEQGVVDMNADISEYWGFEVRNPAFVNTPITLGSLFNETSSMNYVDFADYDLEKTRKALLEQTCFDSGKEPGKEGSWYYRNFGIGVAGTTMELALDGSLLAYSDSWMSQELGINGSFASGRVPGGNLAALYDSAHLTVRSTDELAQRVGSTEIGECVSQWPGGFTCTATEMAKLIAVLANDGEFDGKRILSEQSVADMEKALFIANDTESNSTFSQATPMRFIIDSYGRERLYYHTGNAYGVLSVAAYDPDNGDGVVVITTGGNAARDEHGIYRLCAELMRLGFDIASA